MFLFFFNFLLNILDTDDKGFVKDMLYNPQKATSNKTSLGIICLRRDMLIDIISRQMSHGQTHFGLHSIVKMFDEIKVFAGNRRSASATRKSANAAISLFPHSAA